MLETEQIALIWCYRGYRPCMIKEIGKRKTKIAWSNGETEWVSNKRIKNPKDLRELSYMKRAYKTSGQDGSEKR